MLKHRNSFWCCILLAANLLSGAAAQELPPASTLVELQQRLAEHISQPKYAAALWGVKVVSLNTGKMLFEQNQQKLFSPASNSKLYTVALALDRLGPDYRIKTSLYATAKPNAHGTLEGDLVVYGRGDPTINARLHEGDIFKALEPLVIALTNAGVRRITGDLVGDASFFRGPEFGSGWAWDDPENYYGAELSALTINDNTLQVMIKPGARVGAPCLLTLLPASAYLAINNQTETSEKNLPRRIGFHRPLEQNIVFASGQVPIDDPGRTEDLTFHNPAGLFVSLLLEALARHGIQVNGKSRTVDWRARQTEPIDCGKMVELGFVESLPLSDIVREVQKPSQNLYADLLLAQVGERARSNLSRPNVTSEDLGINELNKFIIEIGIKRGDVLFEEGSGLSRNNLTTPNATVTLLDHMARHKWAAVYTNALPIAGVDGTLRSRMKGTAAAGNVRAKTGTLRWANSLSGYVTTASGEHLIFALMLNRYHNTAPAASARGDLDTIAIWLAGFTGRSE